MHLLSFSVHSLIAIYLKINQCSLQFVKLSLKDASESSLAWRQIIIKHYRVCSFGALILIPLQIQVSHELALYRWSVAADLKKPTLSRPQWELFFFFPAPVTWRARCWIQAWNQFSPDTDPASDGPRRLVKCLPTLMVCRAGWSDCVSSCRSAFTFLSLRLVTHC